MIDPKHLAELTRRLILNRWIGTLLSRLHAGLYRLTRGQIGGQVSGLPVLLLSTRGRKSGKVRTVPLCYLPDGEDWAVAASYVGSDKHPAWWLNLLASSRGEVMVRGRRQTVTALEADEETRTRLWEDFKEVYPAYGYYQSCTSRRIPIVLLRPI